MAEVLSEKELDILLDSISLPNNVYVIFESQRHIVEKEINTYSYDSSITYHIENKTVNADYYYRYFLSLVKLHKSPKQCALCKYYLACEKLYGTEALPNSMVETLKEYNKSLELKDCLVGG